MTTWGVQLSTLESRAAEHEQFAGALITQLADPLKVLGTRTEELRKLHGDYAAKLEKERDNQYGELRKQKGKYDSVCQEVESRRKRLMAHLTTAKPRRVMLSNSNRSRCVTSRTPISSVST